MDKTRVFVVGVMGKMGSLCREAIEKDDELEFVGGYDPKMGEVDVTRHNDFIAGVNLAKAISETKPDVIVDYSAADAVPENMSSYLGSKTPFVVGTTGWDYQTATSVRLHNISCVVDQNMHPVLVALKDALEYMANKYPNILEGYALDIEESHQDTKLLPSGTGPVWGGIFGRMGALFDPWMMKSYRDKPFAHAFHFYTLVKGMIGTTATVIGLSTQIWGRAGYIEGTILAIKFLAKSGEYAPMVYDMRNVLAGEY